MAAPYLFILVPSPSRVSLFAPFLWQNRDIPSTSSPPPPLLLSPHTNKAQLRAAREGRLGAGGQTEEEEKEAGTGEAKHPSHFSERTSCLSRRKFLWRGTGLRKGNLLPPEKVAARSGEVRGEQCGRQRGPGAAPHACAAPGRPYSRPKTLLAPLPPAGPAPLPRRAAAGAAVGAVGGKSQKAQEDSALSTDPCGHHRSHTVPFVCSWMNRHCKAVLTFGEGWLFIGPIKLYTEEDLILYPFTGCICLLPPKLISEDGDKALSHLKKLSAFVLGSLCYRLWVRGERSLIHLVTFHTSAINHVLPLLDFTG